MFALSVHTASVVLVEPVVQGVAVTRFLFFLYLESGDSTQEASSLKLKDEAQRMFYTHNALGRQRLEILLTPLNRKHFSFPLQASLPLNFEL